MKALFFVLKYLLQAGFIPAFSQCPPGADVLAKVPGTEDRAQLERTCS